MPLFRLSKDVESRGLYQLSILPPSSLRTMPSSDEASEAMEKGKGRPISDELEPPELSSTTSTSLPSQALPAPQPDLPHLDSETPGTLHRRTERQAISRPLSCPPSPTMSSTSQLTPHRLLPLLQCPKCSPTALLTAPTTLKCGHSICSRHVSLSASDPSPQLPNPPIHPGPPLLPACPLPTCLPTTSSPDPHRPNIPPESTVTYFPPPLHSQRSTATAQAGVPARLQDVRVDVTICKILSLVQRAIQWQARDNNHVPVPAASDDDGSDDDSREPTPHKANRVSQSLGRSSRPSSPELQEPTDLAVKPPRLRQGRPSRRPFKRQRRGSQTAPPSLPSPPVSPSSRFEKELLTELTCEICFMLLYQPVSTPCQHVRYSCFVFIISLA